VKAVLSDSRRPKYTSLKSMGSGAFSAFPSRSSRFVASKRSMINLG
jgi:hypothetical protein